MFNKPSIPTRQRGFDSTPRGFALQAKVAEERRLLSAKRVAASQHPVDADGAPARSGGAA